jgi:hypothetical protein
LVWAGLIAVFWRDWAAMGHQWWDSSTYNHILMVPAILGWLVAQRLPELFALPVGLWRGGLGLMGAALLLWALPMGLLAAFSPQTAKDIAEGMNAYLSGLPEPLYALFGTGYLGYTAARQWGKVAGSDK